jgi:hypothetical protein
MPADFGDLTRTVESLDTPDLLLKWKEITYALVACGHAAELFQELNRRTGHGDPFGGHAELYPRPTPSDESQVAANNAEIDGPISEFASADEDASTSCPDESESDDDIYDEMNVPSYLIDEAADLSEYSHANTSLSFEKIFAREQSLARCNRGHPELGGLTNCFDGDLTLLSATPPSPLTLPPSASEQNQWLNLRPDTGPEQDLVLEAERRDSIKETKPIIPPPMSPPRRRKDSRKARGLRVSNKQNLTPAEIPVVADLLVSNDAISYFLHNRQLIYESWMPFSAPQPAVYSNSIETSVVAALDTVLDILKGNRVCRLLSRFAYIQLAWLIDAYKAAAATDRVQHKVRRRVGQRDASVAIDLYLETKRKVSGETLKRGQILGYYRTGRRWRVLGQRAPISVFIFPQIADTIVYVFLHPPLVETHGFERQNNSITDSALRALAARIERNRPELIGALMEVGEYAGLTASSTAQTMPRLEDVIASMDQVLGSVFQTIPQDLSNTIRSSE